MFPQSAGEGGDTSDDHNPIEHPASDHNIGVADLDETVQQNTICWACGQVSEPACTLLLLLPSPSSFAQTTQHKVPWFVKLQFSMSTKPGYCGLRDSKNAKYQTMVCFGRSLLCWSI